MIAAIIKSAIILAGAAAVAAGLRRQSAALRHAVWTAGLAGALAVPLFSITLPSWSARLVDQAVVLVDPVIETPVLQEGRTPFPNDDVPAGKGNWSLGGIVLAIWIAGAAAGLLSILGGAGRLAWVAFRAEPLDDPRWLRLAGEIRQALGIRRNVQLLQNRGFQFLGTWGIVSPRILVPAEADTWSDDRIRMVLAHEMAHIRRHDWAVQVLSEAARAIYWFNPVFWLACSRLRQESERACDDTVVRMGAGGAEYAEELLSLSRSLRDASARQSPILAMAQTSHLEQRLVALLNPSLNRLAATPWAVLVVALVAIGLTLPLAAVRSRQEAPSSEPMARVSPAEAAASVTLEPVPQTSPPVKVDAAPRRTPPSVAPTPDSRDESGEAVPAASADFSCDVTPIVRRKRVELEKTAALGAGPWHINEDQTIWAWDQPYVAGKEVNTMWMRPQNLDLIITGRRINGDSATFETHVPSKYATNYVSAALVFPSPGCWEVTGTAGDNVLTFVTRVEAELQQR